MSDIATRKRHERLEIEFLTCRTSYNKCDTQNNTKRVSRISHLQTHLQEDFCDTFPDGWFRCNPEAKQQPFRTLAEAW